MYNIQPTHSINVHIHPGLPKSTTHFVPACQSVTECKLDCAYYICLFCLLKKINVKKYKTHIKQEHECGFILCFRRFWFRVILSISHLSASMAGLLLVLYSQLLDSDEDG